MKEIAKHLRDADSSRIKDEMYSFLNKYLSSLINVSVNSGTLAVAICEAFDKEIKKANKVKKLIKRESLKVEVGDRVLIDGMICEVEKILANTDEVELSDSDGDTFEIGAYEYELI